MRLGLFGGSFDPVHRGHVEPLREARRMLELDRVVCLPTADPPHKESCTAPARARFTMAELAWLDDEQVEVSDFELTPGRTTYTIHSIEHFAALRRPDGLVLLMGEDSLLALSGWRRWRDIVARVEIGVLSRPGFEADARLAELPESIQRARREGRVHLLANRLVDVSSTRLRRLLAEGREPPADWLPDLVLKYLKKYPNLYA